MRPDTHSNASNSPDSARPVLGTTVPAIVAAWYHAARAHAGGTQRVRALALLAQETREFRWEQAAIHRILTTGESRPATREELELLGRAISYGWFLVYLQAGEGQEARVLHQLGERVPHLLLRAQDLALLLQKHALPSSGALVPPYTAPGPDEAFVQQDPPASLTPDAPGDRPTHIHPAAPPGQGRRPEKTGRLPAGAFLAGEGALLLCLILLFTRNLWLVCLVALTALALLNLFLRRLCRPRSRVRPQRAQQQMPSANR